MGNVFPGNPVTVSICNNTYRLCANVFPGNPVFEFKLRRRRRTGWVVSIIYMNINSSFVSRFGLTVRR